MLSQAGRNRILHSTQTRQGVIDCLSWAPMAGGTWLVAKAFCLGMRGGKVGGFFC